MATLKDEVLALLLRRREIRVRRDATVAFFCRKSGGFSSLPAYSSADLSPEAKAREVRKGWTIPATDLGRSDKVDKSRKETVRRWIHDRLLPAIAECGGPEIPADTVAVHLDLDEDGQPVVKVYRKR